MGTARASGTLWEGERHGSGTFCGGALNTSLGEGKWGAAPLELAGPTFAFTSPLPSGETGSVPRPDHRPLWPGWHWGRPVGAGGAAHQEPFSLPLKGMRVSLRSNNYLSLRALTNSREPLPAAGQASGVGVTRSHGALAVGQPGVLLC